MLGEQDSGQCYHGNIPLTLRLIVMANSVLNMQNRGGSSDRVFKEIADDAVDVVVPDDDVPDFVSDSDSESDSEFDNDDCGVPDSIAVQLFGVDCDTKFAEDIARKLKNLRIDFASDRSILDILPEIEQKKQIDLNDEIDALYGEGVSECLYSLNIKLSSVLVCGCGKLGLSASLDSTNLLCGDNTERCRSSELRHYQDLQPSQVARLVATLTGHISLGTNLKFLEMLGALAGYPFRCACGNAVTWLSAPYSSCDVCTCAEGIADFVKHMEAQPSIPNLSFAQGVLASVLNTASNVKDKIRNTGSYIHGLIVELMTSVGHYFNSALHHVGAETFEGVRTAFMASVTQTVNRLRDSLGARALIFACSSDCRYFG